MKRHIITLFLTIAFIFTVSTALQILPYDPPMFMASLQNPDGMLAWLKVRQAVVVSVIASLAAFFLVSQNRKKAQVDAVAVGVLTVLWGLGLRWIFVGSEGWSWFEVTDYLTTALSVPAMVAVAKRITSVGSSCR